MNDFSKAVSRKHARGESIKHFPAHGALGGTRSSKDSTIPKVK